MPFSGLGSAGGTASPLSIPAAAAAAIGDRVVVAVAANGGTGAPTVTDSRGNAYSLDASASTDDVFLLSSVLTTAIQVADTWTVTRASATHIAAAALKQTTPAVASPVAASRSLSTTGASWLLDLGTNRWTKLDAIAVLWNSYAASTRTSTPNTNYTERYDFQVGPNTRTFSVVTRDDTGDVTPDVPGGTVSSSTGSTIRALVARYKTVSSVQASTVSPAEQEASPSAPYTKPIFVAHGQPETGAAVPNQGQLWPRGGVS